MRDNVGSAAASAQLFEQLRGLQHVTVVKAARRLVEEQYRALCRHCRRDSEPLLLPAGKGCRMALQKLCQVKTAQDLLCGGFVLARCADEHLVKHALGKELVSGVLHDHVAAVQPVSGPQCCAVDRDGSAAFFESAEAAGKCRFARAVMADDADNAAVGNVRLINVQYLRRIFVGKAKFLERRRLAAACVSACRKCIEAERAKAHPLALFVGEQFELRACVVAADAAAAHVEIAVCNAPQIV